MSRTVLRAARFGLIVLLVGGLASSLAFGGPTSSDSILSASLAAPKLTSQSALIEDARTGRVLWSLNADQERPMASTTKIMTAMLTIELCNPNDMVTAPPDVEKVKESSMHLKPGEKLTVLNLLYGMLLRSANDGCYAAAVHISGSEAAFVKLMNQKAAELGCTRTHFANCNGLNNPDHYTSARDLATMARAAWKLPLFRQIVGTYKMKINRSIDVRDEWMINVDRLLPKDPTLEGIKTGWTIPAGHCFVGRFKRDGYPIITVVMKSRDWKADTETLAAWAYAHFGRIALIPARKPLWTASIYNGSAKAVGLSLPKSLIILEPKSLPNRFHSSVRLIPKRKAPISVGQQLGELDVTTPDGYVEREPLVAAASVASISSPSSHFKLTLPLLLSCAVLFALYWRTSKSRRRWYGRQGRFNR